jgi:hypothetical protein
MNKLLKLLANKRPAYVGISLSFCVKDLMMQKLKLSEVIGIIANTKAHWGSNDWSKLMDHYGETYWRDDPELGIMYAERLMEEHSIHQPRINNGETWSHDNLGKPLEGYWVQINPNYERCDEEENDNPILDELINGGKIDAIREMKKATGLDLMHCKRAVEAMLEYRKALPSGGES